MRHLLPLRYFDEVARTGSIRGAADKLAITASALNRRILALEEELGVDLFERIPSGVRLSAAGELLIQYARQQISEFDRMRSQLADLSGERRGHVSIACGQALLPFFLPAQVDDYREEHPAVTFQVSTSGREAMHTKLSDYSCDLALVFEPLLTPDLQPLHIVPQQVHVLMHSKHALAAAETVRLRDCLEYPLAFPTHLNGIRVLLEKSLLQRNYTVSPVIESDSYEFLRRVVVSSDAITFQIPAGMPRDLESEQLVSIPVDERDIPAGEVYLLQLRQRNLPVASAKFAESLMEGLDAL